MKNNNAYLDGKMMFSTGCALVASLIIVSCLGCAHMNPDQGSIGFPRFKYGDQVARISGYQFYCFNDMVGTNRLELYASVDKLLARNKKQHVIVIESVGFGGYVDQLWYEWAIITDCHDNSIARLPLYKDGITCVQEETFNLIFEQIAEAPKIHLIPEPSLSDPPFYVTLSIYNGTAWKQVRAINPWAVFGVGHTSADTEEDAIETENVAMRLTFALLAAYKINGISDRLERTYYYIGKTLIHNEFTSDDEKRKRKRR